MMIVLRKQTLFVLAGCLLLGFSTLFFCGFTKRTQAFSVDFYEKSVIVIDAGHGGDDGGAVSADGTPEATLNLEIAHRINDLLQFCGCKTIMTRKTADAVCDEGLSTIRERKVSDIRNRVSLVNSTGNAVLVSIHQNSLPSSPITHGAQVFWNSGENADALAQSVQESLNIVINKDNEKSAKRISPTIYLMKHVKCPAILVECGFLSNQKETQQLLEAHHQKKLAVAIASGYLTAGKADYES